jgi:hypothetical protein
MAVAALHTRKEPLTHAIRPAGNGGLGHEIALQQHANALLANREHVTLDSFSNSEVSCVSEEVALEADCGQASG